MKPLAIDLFCGLGGWTEGCLAEGYDVIGFDIEVHRYGEHRYPAQMVCQDVLTLHGSQFKDAALIVASPPCQEYSYMAMPWKLAKAKAAAIRADTTGAELERLNRLFNACFRIQKEASIAARRHIPCVVENVRGAQPWVGRGRWSYGSFVLWGDVPALMPITVRGIKVPSQAGRRTDVGNGARFTSRDCGIKNMGGSWFNIAHNTTSGKGRNPDGRDPMFQRGFTQTATDLLDSGKHAVDDKSGTKIGGDWFSDPQSTCRRHGSKFKGRKMASAMIAKIPLPLSRHIARSYAPIMEAAE